jgi:phage tail-like protein
LLFLLLLAAPGPLQANDYGESEQPPGTFTFRVQWDGRYIVGITLISGLVRRTEVLQPRAGGDPNAVHKAPGLTTHEPLVLERRLTHDKEFERWANKVWNFGAGLGSEVSLADYRKDVRIDLFDEDGNLAMAFQVYRCWPSDYVVMGELDSNGPSLPVEVLVLQYEGWERDHDVLPAR